MNDLPARMVELSDALVRTLQHAGQRPYQELRFTDYHGFKKARLPEAVLASLAREFGFEPADVQAEIVQVEQDLTHETHLHRKSRAYTVCLGPKSGAPAPHGASAFHDGSWQPVEEGDQFHIPAGMIHGFTVGPGGQLSFLSVQVPPIVDPHGEDDYVRERLGVRAS